MGRRKLGNNIDEKIKNEVMRMTMKVGTGLVSTKELAKKLGISEPVIFTHFRTKAELMNATFIQAVQPFLNDPMMQAVENSGGFVNFALFEEAMKKCLTFKKETVFIHHYLGSSYFDSEVVQSSLSPFCNRLHNIWRSYGPHVSEETYHVIGWNYFQTRINVFSSFIDKMFVPSDENLKLAFSVLTYGPFKAVLVAEALASA